MLDKSEKNLSPRKAHEADPESDFFLWHLCALGVIKEDFKTPLWDQAEKCPPVRVAIIDTGLDAKHPNIESAIPEGSELDYSSSLYGTTFEPVDSRDPKPIHQIKSELNASSTCVLCGTGATKAIKEMLDDLCVDTSLPALVSILHNVEDEGNKPVRIPMRNPSHLFGAHGTACAGLVGGRPSEDSIIGYCEEHTPPRIPEICPTLEKELPYFGVNPHCEIIPICTPYSHEFLPVIHALLYAVKMNADVILMPRGMPQPEARKDFPGNDLHGTRITDPDLPPSGDPHDQAAYATLEEHKTVFEHLLKELSKCKYIVLAAGNDGRPDALAYPASIIGYGSASSVQEKKKRKKNEDKMAASIGNGLVIAAAVNRKGEPSAYSNGNKVSMDGVKWVVQALSDDSFAFHQELLCYEKTEDYAKDLDLEIHKTADKRDQSPWGLLSLDVRHRYGYAEGLGAGAEGATQGDRDSLYTLFGGTSAAASVVAGCISLAIQATACLPKEAEKLPRNPSELNSNDNLSDKLKEFGITLVPQ